MKFIISPPDPADQTPDSDNIELTVDTYLVSMIPHAILLLDRGKTAEARALLVSSFQTGTEIMSSARTRFNQLLVKKGADTALAKAAGASAPISGQNDEKPASDLGDPSPDPVNG